MFKNSFGNQENVCCGLIWLIISEGNFWNPPTKYPIPLISVDVNAFIVHAVAQVEVTQVYVNKEEQPIEAIYYFPMIPDGAVTHFQVELEGRVIKGTVKSHEEAKDEYQKAIKTQTTEFMGEETKADIFKVRVGFLKPGSTVKVIIGYVAEVENEPGTNAFRFYIPTTVAPRYVSHSETDEKAADIRKMKFTNSTPAPLKLKVAVSMQDEIKSIESPTHSIGVTKQSPIPGTQGWQKYLVELSGMTTDMDRDFVLNIVPKQVHNPRLYSEKMADGSTAVMVHLVPSFKLDEQETELIFVLDRSGSMRRNGIELVKEALLLFLHSMPADCYFNIIGFGSYFHGLFPKSVKYDDDTLQEATAHAKSLQADLGGTEILRPLKEIYGQPAIEGYLRQIFVLTDGRVSNTEGVLGLTQTNSHKVRVFSLGIGDGVSHHLVEGIAKAGGGTSAFVTQNESIDKKVLNQLKNALQLSLTDIELQWEGVENAPEAKKTSVPVNKEKTLLGYNKPLESTPQVTSINKQSPKRIPPVYDGSQLLVIGLFRSECPTAVTIRALSPDGPLTIRVEHPSDNDVGTTGMLHRLAAVKLVRELELEIAALRFQDLDDVSGKEEEKKKEIEEIACKIGVTSKYTSFVATDVKHDKSSTNNWAMETRHVPSQLSSSRLQMDDGFIFLSDVMDNSIPHYYIKRNKNQKFKKKEEYSSIEPSCSRSAKKVVKRNVKGKPAFCLNTAVDYWFAPGKDETVSLMKYHTREQVCDASKEMKTGDVNVASSLKRLISLQSFDGSYLLNEELSEVLGITMEKLKEDAMTHELPDKVFTTANVIAFFRIRMSAEKDIWDLVVLKAKRWLTKSILDAREVDTLIRKVATKF